MIPPPANTAELEQQIGYNNKAKNVHTPPPANTAELEQQIGYQFTDRSLCDTALTHTSWCAENDMGPSNQRLEFLGDAVLGLVAAHWLYSEYSDLSEGQMSKARAEMVSKNSLAAAARTCDLGLYLLLGQGEDNSGGRHNPSLLADGLESVIGAIYLDGGLTAAETTIRKILGKSFNNIAQAPGLTDFKSRLQEIAAHAGIAPPHYDIANSGPEHDKRFYALVTVGETFGKGEGSTKKSASQRAAEQACAILASQLTQEKKQERNRQEKK
ncbi:MAG: ribonuclease III [Acidimicrobiaceae bacterium]|nr:ribonuclease III [Acidimicrobiaceae bacterium]